MWVVASHLTRIFLDDTTDEPRIVATLDTAIAQNEASHFLGVSLELGAWHALDDFRTALRAAVENSWGHLDWSGDWHVAGVTS